MHHKNLSSSTKLASSLSIMKAEQAEDFVFCDALNFNGNRMNKVKGRGAEGGGKRVIAFILMWKKHYWKLDLLLRA